MCEKMNCAKGLKALWAYLAGSSTQDTEVLDGELSALAEAAETRAPQREKSPVGTTVATRRHRPKRGRPDCSGSLPVDVSDQGLRRMLDARFARFHCDPERATLTVSITRKGQQCEPEDYPLIDDADELALLLQSAGVTDLLTLAALHPRYFWNAVRLCKGKLERVEREILH